MSAPRTDASVSVRGRVVGAPNATVQKAGERDQQLHEHSPAPILLTPDEAAAILGRDAAELRRWRSQNVGPRFHDLGRGLIRYARESVLVEAAMTSAR